MAAMRVAGAAILASAAGLLVGAAAAAALSAVMVLFSAGLEVESRKALIVQPLLIFAEGMFWALLGGGMYVFPLAVLAFAVFQPRNTSAVALTMSALLLLPIVAFTFPGRPTNALLLALPMWLGVRTALGVFSRGIR